MYAQSEIKIPRWSVYYKNPAISGHNKLKNSFHEVEIICMAVAIKFPRIKGGQKKAKFQPI